MDRLTLVRLLADLTPTDMALVTAAIPDAAGQLSQGTVAEQTSELVRWADSSTGPGLDELLRVVTQLFPDKTRTPSPGDAAQEPPRLFHVPYKQNEFFTGREEILAALRRTLTAGGRAALAQAISGLGGIGKTQTAVEYAYRHKDDYRVVLWVRAETAADIETAYAEIARLLRLPHDEAKPDDAVRALKVWLEQHADWLLIFDNADRPTLLKPYLPPRASGHLLLTSRAHLFDMLGVTRPLELPPLPLPDAVQFLFDRTGRSPGDAAEDAAAETLAAELDGLPLALEQAAAYILALRLKFTHYLAAYRKRRLQWLQERGPVTGDYPASVATTWAVNFAEVERESPASAELLRLSAFLAPDAIPFELLTRSVRRLADALRAALDDDAVVGLLGLLEPLRRFSLVRIDSDAESYSIHRLVQEAVKAGLDAATKQLWIERTVQTVNAAIPYIEFRNWPLCDRLLPHAKAAARLIQEESFHSPAAARLLSQTGLYMRERGQVRKAEPLSRQALEIDRKVLGEEHPEFARSLNNLGFLYAWQGKYAEAEPLLQEALETRRRVLGDKHPDFATSLNNLAGLYHAQGKYAEAEPLLQQALEIDRKVLGDEHPEFTTSLNNLASLYEAQRRYADAESLYRQALETRRRVLGDKHPDFATSLNNLAGLYHAQGKYAEAEPLNRQALEIRRKALREEHPDFALSLNNLASLYHSQGKYAEAEPLYRQALLILRSVWGDDHPHTRTCAGNYAALLAAMGREIPPNMAEDGTGETSSTEPPPSEAEETDK